MAEHALLSASAAHRWLACTAAPRYEELFPGDETSTYAEEGTLAHKLCELKVRAKFCGLSKRTYNAAKRKIEAEELYDAEMDRTSDAYIDAIAERVMAFADEPYVEPEVRLDLSGWVPEGFGTSDCVIVGEGRLIIVDYKHGKGIPVSALGNPQMRLYALGARALFEPVYGPINTITTVIVQPRVSDEPSSETLSYSELLDWGGTVIDKALAAYTGDGAEFVPGEHCRFCRGRAQCKARAGRYAALMDFADKTPEGRVTGEKAGEIAADILINGGTAESYILTDAEIGELLTIGAQLESWYKDLKDYAVGRLQDGYPIAGYKLVEGRSNRVISDVDGLLDKLEAEGYPRAVTTDIKPKSLTELEKLVGKKQFGGIADGFITKPQGAPTLAKESDPRPVFASAETDFRDNDKK